MILDLRSRPVDYSVWDNIRKKQNLEWKDITEIWLVYWQKKKYYNKLLGRTGQPPEELTYRGIKLKIVDALKYDD
uniref:Uncharacterized protein n=1 Tax=viral metagenome TaxID=1070528 RepID=A0A6M3ILU7_9ZZZZ